MAVSLQLAKKITDILSDGDTYEVSKIDNGFQITYGAMYSAPQLSFQKLLALSTLFGTESVDVDNYGYSGCDTCDYGSDYGHTIQIYNPTKNINEMDSLIGYNLKLILL